MSNRLIKPLGIISFLFAIVTTASADNDELDAVLKELHETQMQLKETQMRLHDLAAKLPQRNARSFHFDGPKKRPMVGIIMSPATRDGDGVKLAGVTPEGPADKAGLRSGDIIVSIDSQSLDGENAVATAYDLLAGMQAGQTFEFAYRRDGEVLSTSLTAEEANPQMSFAFGDYAPYFNNEWGNGFAMGNGAFALNLDELQVWADKFRDWQFDAKDLTQLRDLPGNVPFVWRVGLGWSGLELARVNPALGQYFGTETGVLVIDSKMDGLDLRGGDIILAIDGDKVTEPRAALRKLRSVPAGATIALRIQRDGQEQDVTLTAPEQQLGQRHHHYLWDYKPTPSIGG